MTTAHSPPSTLTGTENSEERMLGIVLRNSVGRGGEWWVDAKRRGPVVPKGTLRAPVSPFQTTVWCYRGTSGHEEFLGWEPEHRRRSYKEEGEVEEEEE